MKINKDVHVLKFGADIGLTKEEIYTVVLKDEDSLTLVDTGYPRTLESMYKAFKEEELDINKLDRIILTHQDLDHIGNAKLLKEKSEGKIRILAHEEELDYIEGVKVPLKLKKFGENIESMPREAKKIFEAMKRGFKKCSLKPDGVLRDGEVIPICGGVTVIHTPGHTLGHICLYLNKYKVLIAGDSVVLEDGNIKLTDDMYNYNSEQNKKSVEKLLNYDIDKIICYHGGIFEGNIKNELSKLLN